MARRKNLNTGLQEGFATTVVAIALWATYTLARNQ